MGISFPLHLPLLLLLPWLNLELKMHAILNFRSLERAVNKYEIKCLLKCCGRDVNRIETLTLPSLQKGGGDQSGLSSQITHRGAHTEEHRAGTPLWKLHILTLTQSEQNLCKCEYITFERCFIVTYCTVKV